MPKFTLLIKTYQGPDTIKNESKNYQKCPERKNFKQRRNYTKINEITDTHNSKTNQNQSTINHVCRRIKTQHGEQKSFNDRES